MEKINKILRKVFTKTNILILIDIVLFFLVFSGAFLAVNYFNKKDFVAEEKAGEVFRSNISNIQFPIPEGWEVNNNITLSDEILSSYEAPEIILQKLNSQCVIFKSKIREDLVSRVWMQTSFADRVYNDFNQFDGDWYVASTTQNSHIEFSWDGRQYLKDELRVSRWDAGEVLGLFSIDGNAVTDDCNQDLNGLLEKVESYFENISLTDKSEGIMSVQYFSPRVGDGYAYLSFIKVPTSEKRQVLQLPSGGFTNLDMVVKDNLLYFAGVDSKEDGSYVSRLYRVDPFSGDIKEVVGSKIDKVIHSVFIKNSIIYYLTGDRCIGYGKCAMDLYSVSINGGTPVLISSITDGGVILSVLEGDQFYIEKTNGDAGTFWSNFYLIKDGKEEEIASFSYSVEDLDIEEKISEYKAFRASVNDREEASSVYIQNGQLIFAPDAHSGSGYGSFIFIN